MSIENPTSDNGCDSYSSLLQSKNVGKKSLKDNSSSEEKEDKPKNKPRNKDVEHDKDHHKSDKDKHSSSKDKHNLSECKEKSSSEKYVTVKCEPVSPDSNKEDVWYDLQIDETKIKPEIKEERDDGYTEINITMSSCDYPMSQFKDEPLSESSQEDSDNEDVPLIAHKSKKRTSNESEEDIPLLQRKKSIRKIKKENYDEVEEENSQKKKNKTDKIKSIKQEPVVPREEPSPTKRQKKDSNDEQTSPNASIDSKRRKVVHSEGRQMIDKMYRFLKEEYAFMAAHNNDNCDLSPLSNIKQRTADATGVSVATVTRILNNEEINLPSSSTTCISPKKKRLKKYDKMDVDSLTADAIRTAVHSFHVVHSQIPTLGKLKAVLSEKVGFDGCLMTLRKLLRKLGYRCRKTEDRKVLQERHETQMWRLQYLKQISEYRSQGRPIVYTDQSYVVRTHVPGNTWELKREKINETSKEEKLKKHSAGTRFVLMHAGTKDGCVRNTHSTYKTNSATGDYHSNVSFDNYFKWLNEKLLPNLPEGAVVILDNSACHNVRAEKLPTSASLKSDMQNWLADKGIPFDVDLRKVELYEIIKKNKAKFITYKIDDLIRSGGFEVLRLPPCHPELNAIENIWGVMKNHIAYCDIEQNKHSTERLIVGSVENISQMMWSNCCHGVERKELEYLKFFDCDFELIINVQEESDASDADDDSNESDCY